MSLMSLVRLAEATDMAVVDVTRLTVHGGSMRVFMRKAQAAQAPSAEVTVMLEAEREAGMQGAEAFADFAAGLPPTGGRAERAIAAVAERLPSTPALQQDAARPSPRAVPDLAVPQPRGESRG